MQPSPWTPTANGTPTQVLLVEDDRRLAELVSDYLHEHGFAVQHVARGDLAGAACRQHAPSGTSFRVGMKKEPDLSAAPSLQFSL